MRKIRENDIFIGCVIALGGIITGFVFPQLAQSSQNPLFAIGSLSAIALGTFLALQQSQGTKRACFLMGIIGLCAVLIESIGVATGFPYSAFTYGDALGYKLGDLVPWTVGIAFSPLLFIAYALAEKYTSTKLQTILLATLILVSIDLVLDPTLTALEYWSWEKAGFYYGVPLQNFFGWIISGLIMHTICTYLWKTHQQNTLLFLGGIGLLSFWTGAAGGFLFALPVLLGIVLMTVFMLTLMHQRGDHRKFPLNNR